MRSYAQRGEDTVLNTTFGSQQVGFYIDIGAWSPVFESVTKLFYDRGWCGINVEPAQAMFRQLHSQRVRDINLNIGIADRPGQLTFYEDLDTGRSTFSADVAMQASPKVRFVERQLEVRTLAEVCEEYAPERIDFLKIDVEGYEAQVVAGANWAKWRPRVIVIEATLPGTDIASHELWQRELVEANYVFARFDGINRFYVRVEDQSLLPKLAGVQR